MQNWIAQLVAVVVAGTVIFIIAAVNLRVQRGAVATTQYQASKTNEVDLVGLIDRDFRNIGSSYPNFSLDPNAAIIAFDSSGTFAFWGQTKRGFAPDSIRYSWSQTGTVLVDSAYVPAYSISRTVNGVPAGGSAGSVTSFSLRLLDNDGNGIAALSDTRQIEVNLSIVSSLGANAYTGTNDWQTVIRPTALAR
ncbi:MAG: hypothetical protein WBW88_02605 [Rhodothermales bacterium]